MTNRDPQKHIKCVVYPCRPTVQWWLEHQLQQKCLTENWPQGDTRCEHESSARLQKKMPLFRQCTLRCFILNLFIKTQKLGSVFYAPLLDVYSRAAWKETTWMSSKFSSIDIWTAKPASGFTLGRDNRSVERTKKFPWKVWMERPADEKSGGKICMKHSSYCS